jgi:predicted O-methyltransferase YrrM
MSTLVCWPPDEALAKPGQVEQLTLYRTYILLSRAQQLGWMFLKLRNCWRLIVLRIPEIYNVLHIGHPGGTLDNGTMKGLSRFINNLTGHDDAEIKRYVSEITSNSEFCSQLEGKKNSVGRRQYRGWGWGISETLGILLYSLCRIKQPGICVETGVSTGGSSSYILCALKENNLGELYSMDLEPQSGWLIPDYLRPRWHFIQGASSQQLAPVLEKVEQIDLFFHDSEHTYRNMLWEFETAWMHLRIGGVLLSHNIDFNNAFSDFCSRSGAKGYSLAEMGGIAKLK